MKPLADALSPLLAALILLLPAGAGAQTPEPRVDLSMMESALESAVRQVSLASAAPFFGESAGCRGYRLQGYGAVFVVPPRLVPRRRGVAVVGGGSQQAAAAGKPGAAAAPSDKSQDPMEQILEELRAEQQRLGAEVDKGTPSSQARRQARERELRAMEERVEALQREAERARREAEQAFAELSREARTRLATPPAAPPRPDAATAVGAGAPADPPPPLLAPWRFWFANGPESDPRAPERVVSDVRAAVAKTLESYGARLRGVEPNEFLVVAVDFVTPWGFDDSVRPERTLIVRVRKGELDKGAAGSLPQEEVRKRIEFVEY